jgi:UrcA family protein
MKAAAVAAVTCSALTAGQAVAFETERAPVAVRLSAAGVDFQDKAAVKDFYRRLDRAAWQACDSQVADRALRAQDARCARDAVRQTVASLDRPLVTALHNAKSQQGYARGY